MSARQPTLSGGAAALILLLAGCGGTLSIEAGEDKERLLGASVAFEATASDADATGFEWSLLSQPSGANAGLKTQGPRATLTPDVPGLYELSVTAAAGKAEGTDTVRLTVLPNSRPVADAGPDRLVSVGEHVELDGRGSHDPDPQELAFLWSIVSAPAGSLATPSPPTSRTPGFIADVPGSYTLELAVHDGGYTVTDRVTVVTNRAPLADAGFDQGAQVGQTVTLDGSGSMDPDDDPLTFAWALASTPLGSTAALVAATSAEAHFIPDLPGTYLVELTVSDGQLAATARVSVQVLPSTGVLGSVVYVSPSGSDANPGTEALPLATIAAALTKVQETEQLYRIQLAEGTYAEEFWHLLVDQTVEFLGPASGEAKLVGTGTLFDLRGTSRLTLLQVSLETPGTAVNARGSATYVGLTHVNCFSGTCVQSGQFLDVGGGTVHIRHSLLKGNGGGGGVSQLYGQLSVRDTEIDGHQTAITGLDVRLLVRDSVLRDNDFGIQLLGNSSNDPILLENVTISGSQVAIDSLSASNVRVVGGSIHEGDIGVVISEGAILLNALHMSQLQVGVEMGGPAHHTGEVVTARGVNFSSIAGPAFIVNHGKGTLDLGRADQPGNNQLGSSMNLAIWDKRPVNATGLITVSQTTLNGQLLAPGTYAGHLNQDGFRIDGSANQIHVH